MPATQSVADCASPTGEVVGEELLDHRRRRGRSRPGPAGPGRRARTCRSAGPGARRRTAAICAMSPATAEVSTRSCTSASIRSDEVRAEQRHRLAGQVGRVEDAGAGGVVDVVVHVGEAVDQAHDPALEARRACPGRCGSGCRRAPRRSGSAPAPPRSSTSTMRSECSLCRNPEPSRFRQRSSASSPVWPNGGWPRSWPSAIASVRSSFSRSARATPREMPGHLERVRHPRAEVVALGGDEDLRLALQAPERLRVHDAVAVALERRAQRALVGLGPRPAGGVVRAHGELLRASRARAARMRSGKASATGPEGCDIGIRVYRRAPGLRSRDGRKWHARRPPIGERASRGGRFRPWLAATRAAIRGERDADVPCDGCTACCTASQFVHIGPDETDTLAHIPARAALPRAAHARRATSSSATTSAGTARCWSTAAARSTPTARGRAAPTTAACSRRPARAGTTA